MLRVAEDMDKVGFYSMEVWGGATFDTMHRYLGEDPWERIRTLKKHISKTPFSMLLRGQNLVGYQNYADDVVETFVQRACDNGIDIFRVFDALNDFRNFQTAVKINKRTESTFRAPSSIPLTEQRMGGDIYNIDYYVNKAKQLEELGADTICIKDMAGLVAPYDAYNLVQALKANVKVPIHLHTHFTSGMGDLALFKAIEAGVDIIDTCVGPTPTEFIRCGTLIIALLAHRDTALYQAAEQDRQGNGKNFPKYLQLADNTNIISSIRRDHPSYSGGIAEQLVNQFARWTLWTSDDVLRRYPSA
jgi:pyruvate/oxaloacetate carboxyltransferase